MTAVLSHHQTSDHYLGTELELFREARCWKSYFRTRLAPFLCGDVLEVGAGIGGTARILCDGRQTSWTCLEPDSRLCDQLRDSLAAAPLPVPTAVQSGTTAELGATRFDTILYIDVIEHIDDHRAELARAASLLRPGGHLGILVPAHQFLYTPFDAAIGHYRRYSRSSLQAAVPRSLTRVRLESLDSVGLLASLANRLILKSAAPTRGQILFWDRVLVRASLWLDPLTLRRLGKSVLGVWKRTE